MLINQLYLSFHSFVKIVSYPRTSNVSVVPHKGQTRAQGVPQFNTTGQNNVGKDRLVDRCGEIRLCDMMILERHEINNQNQRIYKVERIKKFGS